MPKITENAKNHRKCPKSSKMPQSCQISSHKTEKFHITPFSPEAIKNTQEIFLQKYILQSLMHKDTLFNANISITGQRSHIHIPVYSGQNRYDSLKTQLGSS